MNIVAAPFIPLPVIYLVVGLVLLGFIVSAFVHRYDRKEDAEPRFVWRFSGIGIGQNNFPVDMGCILADELMTRKQAIEFCSVRFPRGSIVHIDDVNKIITYKVA